MNGIQMPPEEKKVEAGLFDSRTSDRFSTGGAWTPNALTQDYGPQSERKPLLTESKQRELIEKR